jgi:hypothetical protein
VFVKELIVNSGDSLLGVEDGGEIEGNSDVDVG